MDPERNQEKEMKCIQETYKRWKVRQAISVSNGLSSHLLTDRLLNPQNVEAFILCLAVISFSSLTGSQTMSQ